MGNESLHIVLHKALSGNESLLKSFQLLLNANRITLQTILISI